MPLEGNTCQRIAGTVAIGLYIAWLDVHHDAAVGIALITGVLAHAVGHHAPGF